MRKYFRTVPYRVFRILVAFIAVSIPIEAAAQCFVSIEVYNYRRRVPGEVNVECSGIHYNGGNPYKSKYKKGFGNWGVMSYYGAARDGFQFAGWYEEGGLLQWQSCTSKLPKPDCEAYNDNDCTGQKAVPDSMRRYGGFSFYLHGGGTCESIEVRRSNRSTCTSSNWIGIRRATTRSPRSSTVTSTSRSPARMRGTAGESRPGSTRRAAPAP